MGWLVSEARCFCIRASVLGKPPGVQSSQEALLVLELFISSLKELCCSGRAHCSGHQKSLTERPLFFNKQNECG